MGTFPATVRPKTDQDLARYYGQVLLKRRSAKFLYVQFSISNQFGVDLCVTNRINDLLVS